MIKGKVDQSNRSIVQFGFENAEHYDIEIGNSMAPLIYGKIVNYNSNLNSVFDRVKSLFPLLIRSQGDLIREVSDSKKTSFDEISKNRIFLGGIEKKIQSKYGIESSVFESAVIDFINIGQKSLLNHAHPQDLDSLNKDMTNYVILCQKLRIAKSEVSIDVARIERYIVNQKRDIDYSLS